MPRSFKLISVCTVVLLTSLISFGQTSTDQSTNSGISSSKQAHSDQGSALRDGVEILRRFPGDQVAIFTAPVRVPEHKHAWAYLIPFVAAAALIPLDKYITNQLPPGQGGASQTISDVGAFGTAGAVGGLYIYGLVRHDNHARETGILGAESLLDSLLPRLAMSYALGRYRPFQGPGEALGEGEFFGPHRWNTSFPSGHATYTWAMASAIAHEYPSTKSKLFWYGVGTAVAVTRVTSKQHFASDVVAGSALGYFIGLHVWHAHHGDQN